MPNAAILTITRAEILYNGKRVAPYALAVLFSLNALLWWGWGPAIPYGWATNSDFYLARCFGGFVFLTTPFFTAMMMGDPVLRDFRFEIDPLLLSTPVRRTEYLLGKFLGNFLTLTLCFACFALTLFLLQAFRIARMLVLPWRILPYVKHFLAIVVVSHLLIAAFCFTIGTLTRSVKFVYTAVLAGYLFFIFLSYLMTQYAPRWAPLTALTGPIRNFGAWPKGEIVNQYVIVYGTDFIVNRGGVVTLAALLLLFLHWRFTTAAKSRAVEVQGLGLTVQQERLSQETATEAPIESTAFNLHRQPIALPSVTILNSGWRAYFRQFAAMVTNEFKLLCYERSLIILAPLVIVFASLELGTSGTSRSYAVNSAHALLILLSAIMFFYAGEAMHRDRELGIEPTLWSLPVADGALLLSKFAALLGLASVLTLTMLITSIGFQLMRGLKPLTLTPYLLVYAIILLPSVIFVIGAIMMLHVLLRNKYLAHIVGLGLIGGVVWLLLNGYVNGLYNPVLYQLWTYEELVGSKQPFLLLHRVYWLAITMACVAVAHRFYARGATNERSRTVVLAVLATCLAIVIGIYIK
jgi:ABC-2 type transport system permease protein